MDPYEDDERAVSATWLYRYYSEGFDLIYVGISNQPIMRNATHRGKPWHRWTSFSMLECYPLRHLAEAAEEYAIEAEDPTENAKRRTPPKIGSGNAPWFFAETGGALAGIGQYFANPHSLAYDRIEAPDGFTPPPVIYPKRRAEFSPLRGAGSALDQLRQIAKASRA